jgi:hypothetical protein
MSDLINPVTDRTFEVEREDEERHVLTDALMDWTGDQKIQGLMRRLGLGTQGQISLAAVLVDTKQRLANAWTGGLPLQSLRRIAAELLDHGPARKRIARNVAGREGLEWREVNQQLLDFRDEIRRELKPAGAMIPGKPEGG